MMHTIAVHGTPDQVAAEIVTRFGDCDRICAYFPGYDAPDDLIAEFTAAVKAAAKAAAKPASGDEARG